jgi:hypothetical protein
MLLKFEVHTFDLFNMSRFMMISTGWNTSSAAMPVHAENGGDSPSAVCLHRTTAKNCVPEAPEPRTWAVLDSVLFLRK